MAKASWGQPAREEEVYIRLQLDLEPYGVSQKEVSVSDQQSS